ncbi:predicted protein [Chaetoceros tenuissimus]|uniref:Uncharacterized protein n=1 Tax=Chaetoceros tenuissimus TaxID=426638 RepID=A0AAD3CZ39_9STRA|nr:predicted protein [Chaetoceros tenuissimus]
MQFGVRSAVLVCDAIHFPIELSIDDDESHKPHADKIDNNTTYFPLQMHSPQIPSTVEICLTPPSHFSFPTSPPSMKRKRNELDSDTDIDLLPMMPELCIDQSNMSLQSPPRLQPRRRYPALNNLFILEEITEEKWL